MKSLLAYYLATLLIVASSVVHIWLWSLTPTVSPPRSESDLALAYVLGFAMGQCQAACILHTNDADDCIAQFPGTSIPPVPSSGAPLPYGEPCDQYMRPVVPYH